MPITVDEALVHLNIDDIDDAAELSLFVEAANEWIAERVVDTAPTPILTLASLFLVEHWWESQRGPVGTPVDDGDPLVFNGRSYAIPNRVLEILGPWLLDETAAPEFSFPDAVAFPDPVEWPV